LDPYWRFGAQLYSERRDCGDLVRGRSLRTANLKPFRYMTARKFLSLTVVNHSLLYTLRLYNAQLVDFVKFIDIFIWADSVSDVSSLFVSHFVRIIKRDFLRKTDMGHYDLIPYPLILWIVFPSFYDPDLMPSCEMVHLSSIWGFGAQNLLRGIY
jgi:hypothetical protein